MNPKYRILYLLFGAVGLVVLFYQIIAALPEVNPERMLLIAVPDLLVFYLAYRTYPEKSTVKVRS